jgi:hypothetical protein
MDKNELLRFVQKYKEDQGQDDAEEERKLGERFRSNRCVTKSDLKRVIAWKFQGRLLGRRNLVLGFLKTTNDEYIRDVSELAFKYEKDEDRLKLLQTINGVGPSLSSVILSFYDPQRYGILDIHAWRGLFGADVKLNSSQRKQVLRFFTRLREISAETGLPCRDIEKAYFLKDKAGSAE